MHMIQMSEELKNKWAPVVEHNALPAIKDSYRKTVTTLVLENTERALKQENHVYRGMLSEGAVPVNAMGASSSTASDGAIDTFDPVLISLVRRAMPNLIAYDLCGVQPMTGPTGLIFAMRSRYSNQTGSEAFYNEANTAFSSVVTGANTFGQKHVGDVISDLSSNTAFTNTYNFGTAMATAQAEALGSTGNTAFNQMGFSIEKISVTAKSRALKGEYTVELAQDLKAIHGLDAESELANMLSTEIMSEINREVVRTIVATAKVGCTGTTSAGTFNLDVDSNGRWSIERFKGLQFQIEREANQIAIETRRGKGNFILCSADVASALRMTNMLEYNPQMQTQIEVDVTGATFAGLLNGTMRVYIDPYAVGGQYFTVGYRGNQYDAGVFYCPYVPLQMLRGVDPGTLTPIIGFKTRYGMVANPYAEGLTVGNGAISVNSNVFYRKALVTNLL